MNGQSRNEEVRRRSGIERELASRVDQRVLRWFGQVERMDVPYVQKGIAIRSKYSASTGQTKAMLDGWCEGSLGQQRDDGAGFATQYER